MKGTSILLYIKPAYGWETKGDIKASSLLPMHEEGQKS